MRCFQYFMFAIAINIASFTPSYAENWVISIITPPTEISNAPDHVGNSHPMVKLALQEISRINAHGGIQGRKLTVIVKPDPCDGEKSRELAQSLVKRKAKLVIGHFCPQSISAAYPVYAHRKIDFFPAHRNPPLAIHNWTQIFIESGHASGLPQKNSNKQIKQNFESQNVLRQPESERRKFLSGWRSPYIGRDCCRPGNWTCCASSTGGGMPTYYYQPLGVHQNLNRYLSPSFGHDCCRKGNWSCCYGNYFK